MKPRISFETNSKWQTSQTGRAKCASARYEISDGEMFDQFEHYNTHTHTHTPTHTHTHTHTHTPSKAFISSDAQ